MSLGMGYRNGVATRSANSVKRFRKNEKYSVKLFLKVVIFVDWSCVFTKRKS